MHLAITALGKSPKHFIAEILEAVGNCHCNILELRSTHLAQSAIAAYLLVEGNWNHLAKLENLLNALQKRLEVQINTQHTESLAAQKDYIPYQLETISIDHPHIVQDIVIFLDTRNIPIEEIKAYCHTDCFTQTPIFSTQFIILIPLDIQPGFFRDEISNFCNSLNLDAVFEPIKHL